MVVCLFIKFVFKYVIVFTLLYKIHFPFPLLPRENFKKIFYSVFISNNFSYYYYFFKEIPLGFLGRHSLSSIKGWVYLFFWGFIVISTLIMYTKPSRTLKIMLKSNGNSEHACPVVVLIESVQYFAVQNILENILNNSSYLTFLLGMDAEFLAMPFHDY